MPETTSEQATYAKMVQNLWWATGYNVVEGRSPLELHSSFPYRSSMGFVK